MADKLRTTFPVSVSIADGEQPGADKLTAIATQAQNGLGTVETAIGDVWGQGGDTILAASDTTFKKSLQIANVGRLIGVANAISNMYDAPTETINFQDFPEESLSYVAGSANAVGLHLLTSDDNSVTPSDTFAWDASPKPSILDVVDSGDWYYDSDLNKLFGYDVWQSAPFWSYNYEVANWPTNNDTTANIIPHREQDDEFNGLKIVAHPSVSGRYYIFLPPRINLRAGTSSSVGRPIYVGAGDLTDHGGANGSTDTDYELWWGSLSSVPDATDSDYDFYRYRLPTVLNYGSIAAGTRLPDGFLRLYNKTTEQVMDGIVFYKPANATYAACSFCIEMVVSGDTTDLDTDASTEDPLDSGTDLVAHYSTRFTLVTIGTSLADKVLSLEHTMFSHDHKPSARSITGRINHMDIVNLDPPSDASHVPSGVALIGSAWDSDGHLQYHNRFGSVEHSSYPTGARDIYNGAILGDIVLGSIAKGASAPYHNNLDDYSVKICFGKKDSTNGPFLFYIAGSGPTFYTQISGESAVTGTSDDYFGVKGTSTSGTAVYGGSSSGIGVQGVSGSNFGAQFTGNETGAPLVLTPQSAEPSSTQEGQLYYDSDTDKLRLYANGAWVNLN